MTYTSNKLSPHFPSRPPKIMSLAELEPVALEHAVCESCAALVDQEDRFCRFCGQACVAELAAAPDALAEPADWRNNRVVILAILFLGLGPLGLPVLWRSAAFTRRGKILVTGLLMLFAVVSVWAGYELTLIMLEPLLEELRR